jgi:hypothetical protein
LITISVRSKPRPPARPGSCFHRCFRVSARASTFDKILAGGNLRRCIAANDRETGKKVDPAANRIDFPDFPVVV